MSSPHRFAITIGDPQGIGPEIILKAVGQFPPEEQARFILYADPWVMAYWSKRLKLPLPRFDYAVLGIQEGDFDDPERSAHMAWESLRQASRDLNNKTVAAVVTAPVGKERLYKIGFPYPGHTEFFAAESGSPSARMMFVGKTLKIVLETIHLPLHAVSAALSKTHFEETLTLTRETLRRNFHIVSPRLAVCGLNPHAGENGHLGREEIDILIPVIQKFDGVDGPFPSDAYFGSKRTLDYDATICLYHDQGLIPFKMLHFSDGVNVTIGLPYLRTSPDHGPAFDIAGQGKADPTSFLHAMRLASHLTP